MNKNDNKHIGSALVEYVIPTALIAIVVGVGLVSLLDGDKLLSFIANSGGLQIDKATNTLVLDRASTTNSLNAPMVNTQTTNTPPPTSYIPQPGDLVVGNYVFKNIPPDFNEFVETAGATGGTKLLSSMLFQVADQLALNGEHQQAEEVKKLATLGHNIAVMERQYEEQAQSCNYDAGCLKAFNDKMPSIPQGYDTTYYSTPLGGLTNYNLAHSGCIGMFKALKNDGDSQYQTDLNKNHPAALFVDTFDALISRNDLDDSTKGIITELYYNIGIIGEDLENNYSLAYDAVTNSDSSYDPLTGAAFSQRRTTDIQTTFETYNASTITHFDSALICAAGGNTDSGVNCN